MDSNSEKRLAQVHPKLAEKVRELISARAAMGADVRAVQGLRTWAEQDMLYAQGRTRKGPRVTNAKGGQSYHNFGLAVDLCPFRDGKPQWNDGAGFGFIGAVAMQLGLDWGGSWKRFPDRPHVQLKGLPDLATCRMLYKQGGLDAVWAKVK